MPFSPSKQYPPTLKFANLIHPREPQKHHLKFTPYLSLPSLTFRLRPIKPLIYILHDATLTYNKQI